MFEIDQNDIGEGGARNVQRVDLMDIRRGAIAAQLDPVVVKEAEVGRPDRLPVELELADDWHKNTLLNLPRYSAQIARAALKSHTGMADGDAFDRKFMIGSHMRPLFSLGDDIRLVVWHQ